METIKTYLDQYPDDQFLSEWSISPLLIPQELGAEYDQLRKEQLEWEKTEDFKDRRKINFPSKNPELVLKSAKFLVKLVEFTLTSYFANDTSWIHSNNMKLRESLRHD
jgi:hypothetical protein